MPSRAYPLKRSNASAGFKFAGRPKKKRRTTTGVVTRTNSAVALSSYAQKASSFTVQPGRPLGNAGISPKKFITLRYAEEISLNPGIASVSRNFFRLNSIFDPNYSVGGHKPLGADEWSAFYNRYVVRRARIRVTSTAPDVSSNTQAYLTIGVHDRVTGQSNTPTTLIESTMYCKPIQIGYVVNDMDHRLNNVFQEVDLAKFFAVKDLTDEDDFGAAFSGNPTNECMADVCLASINGNDPGSHSLLVEIEYDCLFTDPKRLVQS